MILCKHCGSKNHVKNGIVHGKQRYKCQDCCKTYREGYLCEKHTNEQQLRVIKWYLEGAGIMSIGSEVKLLTLKQLNHVTLAPICHWLFGLKSAIVLTFRQVTIMRFMGDIRLIKNT
jgi:transposase-like protein